MRSASAKGSCAVGNNHELLEVDARVIGVRAAVEMFIIGTGSVLALLL